MKLRYTRYQMASHRPQLRIDVSEAVRNRAKAVAYNQGLSLTEYILQAMSQAGDKDLQRLIEKDKKERTQRGRPSKD